MLVSNQVILQIESDQASSRKSIWYTKQFNKRSFNYFPAMSGPLVHLFGVTQLYVYGGIGLVIIGVIEFHCRNIYGLNINTNL